MPGESWEVSSSFEINGKICTDKKQMAANFNNFFTGAVNSIVQSIGAGATLLLRSVNRTVTKDKTSNIFKHSENSVKNRLYSINIKSPKTNKAFDRDQFPFL